ncbi:ATP synthase subunit b [Streptomyces hundungensis]|uniref:ATP synthase subunit b n=2 Tax=Streptomyces hundungensis TaxID=1077946 RepID=A0A387HEF6_9ACTN|nr:ATP synthase subunit b [Streptomyces hundungensis]
MNVGPLNPTVPDLLIGLVLFLLCFWVMAGLLLPRINRTLREREALTTGRASEAEATLAEAAEVRARYEAELTAARHEAARIRQQAKEEGTAAMTAARADGIRERDELVAAATAGIAAARAAAEAELRPHVDALAAELAGRILGEPLSAPIGS